MLKTPEQLHDLCKAICEVLTERNASGDDGVSALMTVLFNFMVRDGVPREQALGIFADIWDTVERHIAEERPHLDG